MNDITLTANQVVLDRTDQSSFRVLWISSDREEAYWISLSGSRQVPLKLPLSAVEQDLQSGRYAVIADTFSSRDLNPGPTAIQRRDQAWKLISDIVRQEPAIYRLHERSVLLKEASARSGVQVSNIYKYLTRYWRGGMTPNALLPFYENCGRAATPYDGSHQRRGRKKVEGAEGKVLTPEDIQHFTDAILTWYMGPEKLSLEKVYRNMQDHYYVTKDEKGVPVALDPDRVPSRAQFYYWHQKNKDILAESRSRNGNRNYPLRSRASIEKTETFLSGPCASSQIDATIADIFLVSQDNREKIVGRPTMYFLMDSFTRIVMGMYITLEPPSWESASMCILNAMEDKVEFCAKYGVQIRPEDWPCHHIPNVLVGDRGEMESVAADLLVNRLNIRIENMPPYRGDLKGIIEQHFHLIDVDMAHLPGKMGKDYGERCTEDYRLKARLTLNEFIAVVIHYVLLYNNFHYMEGYGKTIQMRQMSVKPIPRDLWNFGMKYLSGVQRTLSKTAVRYAILPTGKASITDHGILFRGLFYGCEQGFREHWFDSARLGGRETVTVSYDPRDASCIYFKPSHNTEPVECCLLDSNKITGRFSAEELNQMHKAEHAERESYRSTEDLQSSLTQQKIDRIVSQAVAAFPAKPQQSNHQRVSDIQANRKEEMERQYQDSIRKKEIPASIPPAPVQGKSRIQQMLEQELSEAYGLDDRQ